MNKKLLGWCSSQRALLNVLFVAGTCLVTVGMSGCDGVYSPAWYNVYGQYCGSGNPGAGCNFYADGSKISAGEDPYSAGAYYTSGQWNYVDSYGYYQSYWGWGWMSSTGILYDGNGNALNSNGDNDSKDLIGNQADLEKQVVTTVGKGFAAKYALSEDTGVHIATTLNDWATLSKKQKRARTDQDVADFSQRLYGVSADQAKTAIDKAKTGDQSGLESANSDVATYWGTSPETTKTILKTWYKDQLSSVGAN